MKKQKVLYLITKSNWGGAQRYVYDLASNLPLQYEPVVAHGGNGKLATELQAASVRTIPLTSLERDISLKKELLSFREIFRLIKAERPDVLHVNSSKAGGIGALCGRLLGVPRVIYTAHGWAFNEDRGRLSRFVVGVFHWLTIMLAHRTITVSDAVAKQMRWPLTKRKMVTVRLGRDVTATTTEAEARTSLTAAVPHLGKYANDCWLGSIGELHPIKRHSVAITAMTSLVTTFPTLRYVIIGDGELRTSLQQQIDEARLGNNVFLAGHIHEASQLLPAFDVFLMPSKSEAAAYAVLEAGQAGLPVVASKVGGIPEWVSDGHSGLLVPPDDPTALATAVAELLRDETRRAELAATLSLHTRQFTTERMTASTAALYATPQ